MDPTPLNPVPSTTTRSSLEDGTNDISRLERSAVRIFRRIAGGEGQPIHLKGDIRNTVTRLRLVERETIVRAAVAGALCGLASVLGIFVADKYVPSTEGDWLSMAFYFGVSGSIGGIATIIEILYLYWDCLRASHDMTEIAGHPEYADPDNCDHHCLGLVRASLDVTDCRTPIHGIDPLSETNRWMLILYALTYKLKVTVSNFVLKVFIRRLVGRVAGRTLINAVAVPVFAVWNALICKWMLRQARVRALGPHLVLSVFDHFFEDALGKRSLKQQSACLLALREVVVQGAAFHPNVSLLLRHYVDHTSYDTQELLNHYESFEEALSAADEDGQTLLLELFAVTCALQGEITRKNRSGLKQYQSVINHEVDTVRLDDFLGFSLEGMALTDV